MPQQKIHDEKSAVDLTKFPLIGMTLERVEDGEPDGFYDEATDTWSHRNWFAFSPKKSNEEN